MALNIDGYRAIAESNRRTFSGTLAASNSFPQERHSSRRTQHMNEDYNTSKPLLYNTRRSFSARIVGSSDAKEAQRNDPRANLMVPANLASIPSISDFGGQNFNTMGGQQGMGPGGGNGINGDLFWLYCQWFRQSRLWFCKLCIWTWVCCPGHPQPLPQHHEPTSTPALEPHYVPSYFSIRYQ